MWVKRRVEEGGWEGVLDFDRDIDQSGQYAKEDGWDEGLKRAADAFLGVFMIARGGRFLREVSRGGNLRGGGGGW